MLGQSYLRRLANWRGHGHAHPGHAHTHGTVDPDLLATDRGIWALKWSFAGLVVTSVLQVAIVVLSGSVALLADTVHNFGDATTAIPLWVAFALSRRPGTKQFTYGFGRVEDVAGLGVILAILASALLAGYESLVRLFNPHPVGYVWAVAIGALVGFAGNELVAAFRIKVGHEIGSAALVADGYHARADGIASLSVLLGALGIYLGFPLADPIVGLVISAGILYLVWEGGKPIFTRLMDGSEPMVIDEIRATAGRVPGVCGVSQVRARWLGHRLHAELNIAVSPDLSVGKAHAIAGEVRHRLLHRLRYLSGVTIHVDPSDASGEEHHHIAEHRHGGFPRHSH